MSNCIGPDVTLTGTGIMPAPDSMFSPAAADLIENVSLLNSIVPSPPPAFITRSIGMKALSCFIVPLDSPCFEVRLKLSPSFSAVVKSAAEAIEASAMVEGSAKSIDISMPAVSLVEVCFISIPGSSELVV
jgi:hypothetical protein